MFGFGLLAVLPKIIVSYVVGLGIEFIVAQWKHEEIQEGYLVTGILVPMIVPVDCPLWIIAIACAFAVIFAKEIFGGTGMNIFNVALITRAFLFFAYPTAMSGDACWVAKESICGLGNDLPDTFTMATPLGEAATGTVPAFSCDQVIGLIPGSIGETSVIAIAIGAVILCGRVLPVGRRCSACLSEVHSWLGFSMPAGWKVTPVLPCLGISIWYWAASVSAPCSWLPTP